MRRTKLLDAFILRKSTMGGSEDMFTAYLDRKVAEMKAAELAEEWVDYTVKPVKVRPLNKTEGAVGRLLVTINRETAEEAIRAVAIKKLSKDERKVLGV